MSTLDFGPMRDGLHLRSRAEMQCLHAYVAGIAYGLRAAGLVSCDAILNDTAFVQFEIERHYREKFGQEIPWRNPWE